MKNGECKAIYLGDRMCNALPSSVCPIVSLLCLPGDKDTMLWLKIEMAVMS